MRFVWWVGLFCAAPCWALPALDQARAELKALRYPAAEKSLKAAANATGLSRAEVLEFYELKALTAAGSNRVPEARAAFTTLLTLDPAFKLKGKPAPRITTTFFEARSAAREQGALEVHLAAQPTSGRVGPVRITVFDAAKLVRTVVAELETQTGTRSVSVPSTGGSFEVAEATVAVRVTVKGEQDWVLLALEPTRYEAPAAPVAAVAAAPEAPATVTQQTATVEPRFRPLAYALAGTGAAALATGLVFGLLAQNARTELMRVDLTRAQALTLAPEAVAKATIANVLFISGGTLLAAGVVTFLLGLPPPPVAVVPVRGGVVITGGVSW